MCHYLLIMNMVLVVLLSRVSYQKEFYHVLFLSLVFSRSPFPSLHSHFSRNKTSIQIIVVESLQKKVHGRYCFLVQIYKPNS